ncbi:DUF411 domain-containing protein [Comamonas sediminis]|uniref:DUF411 domain-containing protein n=2 Tax=Comamonas sediminis TaxID=1783360 RepID=A0ABV4B903_9BURK
MNHSQEPTMRNPHAYNRRRTLQMLAAGLATAAATGQAALAAQPAPTPIEVWKDPNCGCCKDWIALMEQGGFSAKVHDSGNNAVRAQLGLPARLGSCHTALVGGYLVEGHVPPADVRKLLQQKPKALGIAVPGMLIGSPGMDGPAYGGRKDPFDVLLVTRTGAGSDVTTRVFSAYRD